MQLGMIGLGRLGANLVRRLLRDGHQCVVFDVNPASVKQLETEGAVGAASLDDLAAKLAPPRAAHVLWTRPSRTGSGSTVTRRPRPG